MMDALEADVGTKGFAFKLWTVVLGPPVVWAVRFMVVYGISPIACAADATFLLHAITVAAVAVTAGMGWFSWRLWKAARRALDGHSDDEVLERVRAMALFGLMSSALFTLVIIAEGLANVMIDPCMGAGPLTPH